ncbi:CDP-glycerol glycerophosphotransferase family protein [Bacillus wiedmannii]|uniref:CDP-glycerol glycerophosphotransferase family protein n=1 Tax=Bacillus wiedmannii TaxID=1890302 RepID=UPI0021CF307E|nr:CDP-glycerol glycerophosphotransferase family protein [Bacillus wiedmannii]MCU5681706.1 CDP-glycerol glycerophosphotransferase family protein [Bacillus wiedmannii]
MADSSQKIITKIRIISFKKRKGKWQFGIRIKCKEKCMVQGIALKKRNGDKVYQIAFQESNVNEFDKKVTFEIDLNQIELGPFFWDFYVQLKSDILTCYRIKHPNYMVNRKINNRLQNDYTKDGYVVYPYVTVKNGLSLHYRKKGPYDKLKYAWKEKLALILYYVLKCYWDRKSIILVYEKFSQTAQDNSYYFFKYCCDHKRIPNIYYVINKRSKDYKMLDQYKDKVVDFLSVKHMIYLLASKFMISSESKAHSYIWKENRGMLKKVIHAKKHVFLQHGVIGLKKVDSIFKKGSPNGTDLFCVSSEYEKEIVKRFLHYREDEIIVSGLARWDHLQNRSGKQKQILLLPTWREWLDEVSEEEFLKSQFYRQYERLINDANLIEQLEKHNIILKFCMHPRIHNSIHYFHCSTPNVQVIDYGNIKINELIMESSLLITDYSSIAWDMYYLKKPIIFFQFDYIMDGYLNIENELFGDRCVQVDELVKLLKFYISNGFTEKKKYKLLRKNLFSYTDQNNSKRVVEGIRSKEKQLKN